MPQFYEIVHARIRDGIEQEMIARRPALEAAVREQLPGLLDIRLVRLDDGTYLDVLRWESRAAADAGSSSSGRSRRRARSTGTLPRT